MIEYQIGSSGETLVITDDVIKHFSKHRQLRWYHREAGGQLFARFEQKRTTIEEATGPRRSDRRTRTSYFPDRLAEQAEIRSSFLRGLHFIGDWHTHPDPYPTPSDMDIKSIAECFHKSTHNLKGFLIIIVGQVSLPDGLHVSVHDGTAHYHLEPLSTEVQKDKSGTYCGLAPPELRKIH